LILGFIAGWFASRPFSPVALLRRDSPREGQFAVRIPKDVNQQTGETP
jgi:hypothetical protein